MFLDRIDYRFGDHFLSEFVWEVRSLRWQEESECLL